MCVSSLAGFSQEITLEDVSTRGFSGVQSLNGDYFYTFFFGEKTENKGMANFILAIYDKDLKEVKKTEVEISKNSYLAASCFNGNAFLFIFSDPIKRKRTTASFDKTGTIIKLNVEEDVRSRLLMSDNDPVIHGINDNEFLVIRPEKDKKFGYQVERISKELVSVYNKSYFPEKGIWSIEDSKLKDGKLFMLRKEKANALTGDKHVFSVQALSVETGDQLYATALVNEEDGGYPDFITVDDKGQVATGGMFFNDGKYDEKNSDGLFFALLNTDGTVSKFNKTSWKKVKDLITGDFSTAIFGGKTKVLIEGLIQKKDGTYVIVGETWRKSMDAASTGSGMMKLGGLASGSTSLNSMANSKEKGFTVMDFSMFNFDSNGELKSIDRIEKTTKEAVIKGSLADEKGLAMAQELHKRKFFCYRNLVEANGTQYIMYKNDDGIKTRAYFLPVGATSAANIGSIDMDKWVSEGLNKVGKFSKAMSGSGTKYTFEDEGTFSVSNPELYKNVIPASSGKVLLYHLHGNSLSMWLESIPQ